MEIRSLRRTCPANFTQLTRPALLAAAVIVACSGTSALAQTVLSVTEDGLVLSTDNTNNNTGQFREILASETGPATGYWGSWMKFDLSAIQGQQISSVTLELTAFLNHSATPIAHQVFSSTIDSWSEATITGLNQPGEDTLSALSVTTIPNVSGVYSWDVTSAVTGIAGNDNVLSLFIRPEAFPVGVSRGPHFHSRESGLTPAQLRVTFVPAPSVAVMLGLGGLIGVRRRR